MKKSSLLKLINFWPPFFGAGIKVKKIAPDFTSIDVEMRLHFWNRNYVGTHFGGSLYSMTDPFLMLMLIENLGKNYTVWDKSASIAFKRPGRGTVHVQFVLTHEKIESIRRAADLNHKVEPEFIVLVVDEKGETVAEVKKLLYVSRKK